MAESNDSAARGNSTTSNPTNDLELLERVFLKFVVAETDEQLEKALSTFLTPALLKVGSSNERVKNKVIELLTHINKRLKSRSKIKLPIESLLKQYEDFKINRFITNFTMIYIKMGFCRISLSEQLNLVPRIFNCMKNRPTQQQELFLQLVIPSLNELQLPDDLERRKSILCFHDDKQLQTFILDFMMDFLFLPYSNESSPSIDGQVNSDSCPPGLSKSALQRLKFEPILSAVQLEQSKLGVVKVLASDVFPPADVVVHFIVATGDSKSSVSDKGEHCLKRFSSSLDWEKIEIIDKLYKIFQGTVVAPGNSKQALSADQARTPAHMRLKLKIFPYLLRSRIATNLNPPAAIKIIFENLFGEITNSRLKKFAIEFCHHMCQYCTDKTMAFVSPLLYQAFIKIISEKKEETKLRGLSFSGLGKLANRASHLFKRDIALVQKLFNFLQEEEKDILLSVQEALSMIAPAYYGITGTDANLMEALILSNIEKESSQARLAALQFANAVFPVTHVSSRYACLLSCADMKDDVKEEAKRGLKPNIEENKDNNKGIGLYPLFPEICDYLHVKVTSRLQSTREGSPVFPGPVFEQVLSYLRLCLHASADVSKQQLMTGDTLNAVSKYATALLDGVEDITTSCIGRYIAVLKLALAPFAVAILHTAALESMLELSAALPDRLSSLLKKDISFIKKFMQSSKESARIHAARILSIVIQNSDELEFMEIVKEMLADMNNKDADKQQGAIFGLAFCISRRALSYNKTSTGIIIEEMETNGNQCAGLDILITDAVKSIAMILLEDDTLWIAVTPNRASKWTAATPNRGAACHAIGELGRYMPLPFQDGTEDKGDEAVEEMPEKKIKTEEAAVSDTTISKLTVTTKLISLLDSKDTKMKERAATSLGYLLIGEPKHPHKAKILEALFSTAKARQLELNFTVGEALSCIGAGNQSLAAKDKWLLDSMNVQITSSEHSMTNILDTIFSRFVNSTANFNKQAAAVWLLSIVKYASEQKDVKERIEDIQGAFMELLSSSDDITQDVASRGVSLVYEQVGEGTKDELVSLLVERLTTGKRPKQKVDANTEIFEKGNLGSTPDGGSLSTYKELCSLASSLNQPDLVYKFMNLANHSAIWNSRKGAAFGFLSIASQAGKQLEPFLPQLIPKLYRYQYDPNPDVQKAMANIWSAVVPDGKKSLDKYTKEIANDLIDNMTNYQWRIRESSCSALGDLIRSAPAEDIVDLVPKIWETNFKVLDDIKESVRKSATLCCKTLSKVTIRICDVTQSKLGEKAVALVLPVFLNTGLASRVDAVKAVSLETMVKISKTAGKLLKPHIAKLVTALLESLSGLEPQYLNTLNLQLSKSKDAQDKLDAIRVSASKSSPMMDTINMCVQYVDSDILGEVIPRLSDLIKTGIGLGTKVGCASFVVSLTLQCRNDLLPFSGKLLASLVNGLSVPNNTVKRSYANAIGHLVMYSKDSSIEKLIEKLKGWYLEKEDSARQLAVAWTFQAISRHSPDILRSHSSAALPLVFLAMHQEVITDPDASESPNNNAKDVWEEVWQNSTPGTQSGIKLYLSEIFETVTPVLSSQSWKLKAQAAKSIGTIADSLGVSLSQPYLGKLLVILLEALPGRIWDGKQQLLKSLSSVCINCKEGIEKSYSSSTPCPKADEMIDSMLKECRKENIQYKIMALNSVSDVIEKYEIDRLEKVIEIVNKHLKKKSDKEEDDDDVEDKSKRDSLISCCVNALGKSWPLHAKTQESNCSYILEVFARLLNSSVWRVQLAILQSSEVLFKRLKWKEAHTEWKTDGNISVADHIIKTFLIEVFSSIDTSTHASVRLQGLVAVFELLNKIKDASIEDLLMDENVKEKLKEILVKHKDSTNYEISQIVNKLSNFLSS
eukprot:Seg846.4 transcript_id=Seg846.4/GoldUCD/mRNA.D3Y31 product="Proteasome adapter and scaffold protein ECM29" protein_id=Seg846.4/GoldUCD/D3Y31